MTLLTVYRLSKPAAGPVDFDCFVHTSEAKNCEQQTITTDGFKAKLYIRLSETGLPTWASFLKSAFQVCSIMKGASPSALLLVELTGTLTSASEQFGPYFALSFGPTGRFMLRGERIVPHYGLRAALNMIYPEESRDSSARLRAIDSKRHGATVMRARAQASTQVELEAFDFNKTRDLLDRASGTPACTDWGRTVSGSDAITLNLNVNVGEISQICRNLDAEFIRTDYKGGFSWIDDVRAVTKATTKGALEAHVIKMMQDGSSNLHLAPGELLDWSRISSFQYRPDAARAAARYPTQELHLSEYLRILGEKVKDLSIDKLRHSHIAAIDDDGQQIKWSVWRCLVGEFAHDGNTYLLDDGTFFEVSKEYLSELNNFIDTLSDDGVSACLRVDLPTATRGVDEATYNTDAAARSADLLLLDRRTVGIPGSKSKIEICDLLSSSRHLVHVKRHLGSATLSHLFAQGLVSAALLQSSVEFRERANCQIAKYVEADSKEDRFNFFDSAAIMPADFKIVYAIVEDWEGRKLSAGLPFFSKVNLREAAINLGARGFKVMVKMVEQELQQPTPTCEES